MHNIGVNASNQRYELEKSRDVKIRSHRNVLHIESGGVGVFCDTGIPMTAEDREVSMILEPLHFIDCPIFLSSPIHTTFEKKNGKRIVGLKIYLHGLIDGQKSDEKKKMKKNTHFADLAPFLELFREGIPVICYHKVGSKPHGTKLRGIYVTSGFFRRQMKELHAAGFTTSTLDESVKAKAPNEEKKIVFTFDDGSVTVLKNAVPAMAKYGFTAINYLVSDLIGGRNEWDIVNGEVPDRLMDDGQVKEWLAAGHEIGSHTRTHPHLSKISISQAREEIFSSKKILEDRFGVAIRHFCYPYGDYSQEVRDLVEEAGYETAVTTDWNIWCAGGDPLQINRIGARAYSLNFRNVMRRIFGRPQGK